MLKLVLVNGVSKRNNISLQPDCKILVGRGKSCDMQIVEDDISREHFEITHRENTFWIRDNNSFNGTYINGEKVKDEAILQIDDEISIGNAILQLRDADDKSTIFKSMEKSVVYSKDQSNPTFDIDPSSDQHQLDILLMHEVGKLAQNREHNFFYILGALLEMLIKHFSAERGYIRLKPNHKDSSSLSIFRILMGQSDFRDDVFLLSNFALSVSLEGTGLISSDTHRDKRFKRSTSVHKLKICSIICVPIQDQTEIIGSIYLDSQTPVSFTKENLDLLTAVGKQIGIAISSRQKEEGLLRRSESRNRALIDAIPDTMLRLSKNGNILGYKIPDNDRLVEDTANIDGKNINQALPQDLTIKITEYIKEALVSKKSQLFEYSSLNKQDIYEIRLVLSGMEEVLIIIRDITERKMLEERIKQSSKLAVLGLFSAGIVHEIGNPLASMSARLQRLQNRDNDEFVCESVVLLQNQVNRLNQILRSISSFSRSKLKKEPCNINSILRETIELLKLDPRGKKVKIILKLSEHIEPLYLSPNQVQQAIVNICINAFDAMPEGGILNIETVSNKETIEVSISDTGIGLSADHRDKIFQPFFSTKDSVGVGLGLYLSSNYVQAHGGTIRANSKDKGSEFIITFPKNT